MDYINQFFAIESNVDSKRIVVTTSEIKRQLLAYRRQHKIIDGLKIYTQPEFIQTHIYSPNIDNLLLLHNNNPFATDLLRIESTILLDRQLTLIDQLGITEHQLDNYLQQMISKGYVRSIQSIPTNYQIIVALPKIDDLLQANLQPDSIVVTPKPGTNQVTIGEYSYLLNEIEDTFAKVSELLNQQVKLEAIKIIAPSEYNSLIAQVASQYAIPLTTKQSINMIQMAGVNAVLDAIEANTEFSLEDVDQLAVEQLATIINRYVGGGGSLSDFYPFIANDVRKATVTISDIRGLTVENQLNQVYSQDDYRNIHLFLLGNYQDGLVTYVQDDQMIDDKLRAKYQLPTSQARNSNVDLLLTAIITNCSNLTVSYSKKTISKNVELANNLSGYDVVKVNPNKVSLYSSSNNQLRFARANYIYQTFDSKIEDYNLLADYYNVDLKDHEFNGVKRKIENLTLSYTSINNFYKCQYKFYLEHILRIKNGKFDNRKVILGNIVHSVLESLSPDRVLSADDIFGLIEKFVIESEIPTDPTDSIYFRKFATYLELVCGYMNQEEADSRYPIVAREKEFELILDQERDIKLQGKLDKVMSRLEGDDMLVEIYDYKTGMLNVDFGKVQFGLNMQNLIYMLLIRFEYRNEDGEEVLDGTYQHQLKPKLLYDDQDVIDTMQIKGYTKLKTEGVFKRKQTVVGNEEFEELLKISQNNIEAATDSIIDCDFKINPKIIDGKNESCSFCDYVQICNKTNSDYIYLSTKQGE